MNYIRDNIQRNPVFKKTSGERTGSITYVYEDKPKEWFGLFALGTSQYITMDFVINGAIVNEFDFTDMSEEYD